MVRGQTGPEVGGLRWPENKTSTGHQQGRHPTQIYLQRARKPKESRAMHGTVPRCVAQDAAPQSQAHTSQKVKHCMMWFLGVLLRAPHHIVLDGVRGLQSAGQQDRDYVDGPSQQRPQRHAVLSANAPPCTKTKRPGLGASHWPLETRKRLRQRNGGGRRAAGGLHARNR